MTGTCKLALLSVQGSAAAAQLRCRRDAGSGCVLCAEVLTRQGSQERTTFKLRMAVRQLEATLNYEGPQQLALLSVQDLGFDLALHPASMALSASLGNVRAQDASLAQVRHLSVQAVCMGAHSRVEPLFRRNGLHICQPGQCVCAQESWSPHSSEPLHNICQEA